MSRPLRIGIVAAEPSADQLGVTVVLALKALDPDCIIEGVAGPKMVAQGVKPLWPAHALSVMGVTEVLKKLGSILKIRRQVISYFRQNPPDLFIGIDAPDFNLTVEEKLKTAGIPVIHYVSPSVWAWKSWRIHKIKRATDCVLCLFPFEVDFYAQHKHPAHFVGHPLADDVPLCIDKNEAKQALGLVSGQPCLGVLPGSRRHELERLLPVFLDTVERCQATLPELQCALPVADESLMPLLSSYRERLSKLRVKLVNGKAHQVLAAADVALLASGTVTLEAMLYKTPMVVAYKLSRLTYCIGRLLIKIRRFSLPNIIFKEDVVPEFIQDEVTEANLSEAVVSLFENKHHYQALQQKFQVKHEQLQSNTQERLIRIFKEVLAR